ncbi:MAG TPA: hypothetical protein VLA34_11230 [Candidatus Krumholzibacterium sp.]|nr:hypothetical protein [Candidatus Krumholzibacterium sp.]
MFRITFVLSIVTFVMISPGCAYSPPGLISEPGIPDDTQASEEVDLEDLFVELHGGMLDLIRQFENEGGDEDLIIELKSIVQIAEETYLRGNLLLAVRLLKEAELLSRQNPR